MARYDRIAPLTSPERDQAFPGWPVLRDIEGQDRDADACRRARLRFLALRPARRLADRPGQRPSAESYGRQIQAVRDELTGLTARDAERVRITRFLRQIEDADVKRLVPALLQFAEQAYAAGHVHAALEYAHTADMAESGAAASLLARIGGAAATNEDHGIALESGWNELRLTDDVERRALIMETIGRALLGMHMFTAADRCFAMVIQRQTDLSIRSRARAAYALVGALVGDVAAFHERRTALLNDDVEWAADPRVAATVHIDLAHGSVVIGDLDYAREHLRTAIMTARQHNYADPLKRAEEILVALEHDTEVLLQPVHKSSETAARIAARIEELDLPTPATA
jgi:hypothetical protein